MTSRGKPGSWCSPGTDILNGSWDQDRMFSLTLTTTKSVKNTTTHKWKVEIYHIVPTLYISYSNKLILLYVQA